MRVVVTGAGGFIGSHVVEALLEGDHDVVALVHYNSAGRFGHLEHVTPTASGRIDVVAGDVTDRGFLEGIVTKGDTVIHLAALIGIPYSYRAPESYVRTNITGTLNVLEAARSAGVRRIITTSTSEVYGSALQIPIHESHPLQAQSPYAASKIAADMLALSYYRAFDLPVVVLRPFNTYGPRQSARAFIPSVLTQAIQGHGDIRVGNLEPRRDLVFVRDTARAFALAVETSENLEGEVIHFGTGQSHSMREVAELCLKVAGSDAALLHDASRQRPEASEVDHLCCDPTQARQRLGWRAVTSLESGLEKTTEHLRENLGSYKPGLYNM